MNTGDLHFDFTGLDKGIQVNYSVSISEKASDELKAVSTTEKDSPTSKHSVDLIMRRVISNSQQYTKKLKTSSIHIDITDVTSSGEVKYRIREKNEGPTNFHEIALDIISKKDKEKEIDQIVKHKIHPLDKVIQEKDTKSILERFSSPVKEPKTPFEKIIQVFSNFMEKITAIFRKIERLWNDLTGKSEIQFQWDISLLSEIFGTPPVNGVTQLQSLKYMSALLDREQSEVADPELQKRFKKAVKLGDKLENLRGSYNKKKAHKVLNYLRSSIVNLSEGEKILIPVGFSKNGQLEEMLLEISKNSSGKCNVALISSSEEVRDLFDKQEALETVTQSLRREIINVDQNELLAKIPTFIELQTNPSYFTAKGEQASKTIFLQSLKFNQSRVEAGKLTETYQKEMSPGKFQETLAYLRNERKDFKEGKRFELAVRLHFFLDICKKNKRGLKNKEFWLLVKNTAHQAAQLIEEDKDLLGSPALQAQELGKVYYELRNIIDELEVNLPQTTDLTTDTLSLAQGNVSLNPPPLTPPLLSLTHHSIPYPTVELSLAPLDRNNIAGTFRNWGLRAQAFSLNGHADIASDEMKLMLRTLSPTDYKEFIEKGNNGDIRLFLNGLKQIKSAIQKSTKEREETLLDIASLAFVDLIIREGEKKINVHPTQNASLADLNAVLETRLTEFDRSWIKEIRDIFFSEAEKALKSNRPLPLYLKAPKYAEVISQEITNKYLTETCPLGCIGDNCPNYAAMGIKNHTYHPVYMLHQFVDTFCEKMIKQGKLKKDELVALMYTQETNQQAHSVWTQAYRQFEKTAHRFDTEDYKTQTLNAFSIYLDRPHFFKYPELRWHFETKILTHETLEKLLSDPTYEPFFHSIIKKLNREITAAYTRGDKEVGAYLMKIFDEMKEIAIKNSDSEDLKLLFNGIESEKILEKWTLELLAKKDEFYAPAQKMLFSLYISSQYRNLIEEESISLTDDKIEMLISAIARLEKIGKGDDEIDPEIKDRYRSILSVAMPTIQSKITAEKTKGEYVNRILQNLNEPIAAQRLQWDSTDFPIFTAESEDGEEYQFDISKGELSLKERKMEELPRFLKKNEELKRLFGSDLNGYWKLSGIPAGLERSSITAFTHDKYPSMRIVLTSAPNKPMTTSKIIVEQSIDSGKKRNEWVVYTRFKTQDLLAESTELLKEADIDLPVHLALAVGERSCWIDRNKERIYVFEEGGKTPWAVMNLKKTEGSGVEITNMEFLSDHSHLLEATPEKLDNFSSFEDPQFIQLIGKDKKTTRLDFSRLQLAASGAHLSYHIGKKGITTQSIPGYTLAPFGERPGVRNHSYGVEALPSTFDGFQLFKKGGEERLLIPVREFELDYTLEGDRIPIAKSITEKNFDKTRVYEYQVNKETNRLVAKTGDAYAYLAYIALSHNDYGSAAFYLDKAKTLSGYGENYEKIFAWLDDWSDDTPNGIALRLRFEIFREEALNTIRLKNIQAGADYDSASIASNKATRLETLMEHYDTYMKGLEKQGISDAFDLSLRLNPDEEKSIEKLISDFMKEHGDDDIRIFEPKPLPAAAIPLQKLMDKGNNKINSIGIRQGVLLLWSYKGAQKNRSPFLPSDPRWILENFRDIFNRVLREDTNSIEFKEVIHQVRMLSELTSTVQLDENEKTAIELAQFYLLKVITIKEDQDNSSFFADLEDYLQNKANLKGSERLLPPFKGALFKSERVREVNYLNCIIARLQESDFLEAEDLFKARSTSVKATEAAIEGARKLSNILGVGESELRQKINNLLYTWSGSDGRSLKQDLQELLMSEIFGIPATKNLILLNSILGMIEGIPISMPKQGMAPKKAMPTQRRTTYMEKYGHLLNRYDPVQDELSIEHLERKINAKPSLPPPPMITTPPSKIEPVIDAPLLSKLNTHFQVDPLKGSEEIDTTLFDDLMRSPEQAYARNAKKNLDDLNAFIADRKSVSITKDDAVQVAAALQKERGKIVDEKEKLRQELLQSVDLFDNKAGITSLRRLIGKEIKPSLDALILLWRRDSIDQKWSDDHPFRQMGMREISENELKRIDENITKYLGLQTEHEHLNRVIELSSNYINSCKDKQSAYGDPQIAEELYDTLQVKRYYSLDRKDNSDYKNLLYMEYVQNIILREGQVTIKREMVSEPNAVRQLRPGYGKTAVLAPLLGEEIADGTNLVGHLIPEELFETNSRDFDEVNRKLTGKKTFKFEFSLRTDTSLGALNILHKNFLELIDKRGFFISTKKSILGLINTYKLMLNELGEMDENTPVETRAELVGRIRVMSKIVSILYNKTSIIADEIDACLDVRKEVNFAMGSKVPVEKIEGDVGFELMSIILKAKEGDPLFNFKEAILSNTQAETFSKEQRLEQMKILATLFVNAHLEEIKRAGYSLSPGEMIDYLMNAPQAKETEKWVFALKERHPSLFKTLTAAKGFIDVGYGRTLGQTCQVNYIRDPVSMKWTIPAKSSDVASVGSEIEDDIERISKTYQDYVQRGVSYPVVYQIIAGIKNRAINELKNLPEDQMANILDTEGERVFQTFIRGIDPENKLGRGVTLATMDSPQSIESVLAVINSSPMGKAFFCHQYVIADMDRYSSQVTSVSTDVADVSLNFRGFTGTPWNKLAYHDKIDAQLNLGTDGMTWELMLQRDVPIHIFDFDAKRPVDSLLNQLDVVGNYQAVIDCGTYLRGISTKECADLALAKAVEKGKKVDAAVYIDESRTIVKKVGAEGKAVPITSAEETDLMNQLTIYGDADKVGVDIKQGKKAKALVTIGPNTFIRDLFQSVWRMRQLHQGQRVELAVSEEVKNLILNGEQRDLTPQDIYRFCLINETIREADDNYRAEKDKIQGATKRAILPEFVSLITGGASDKVIQQVARQLATGDAGFFIKKKNPADAYDQYGKLKTMENPQEVFEDLKFKEGEKCRKVAQAFDQLGLKSSAGRFKKLNQSIEQRNDKPADWFPNHVEVAESGGAEVQQEAEAEQELAIEMMLENEQQTETQQEKEINIPIVQAGKSGSGDVHPLKVSDIEGVFNQSPIDGETTRKLSNGVPYFDEEIYTSAVFERNLPKDKAIGSPQTAFYSSRKFVTNVLIAKRETADPESPTWAMFIPTIHEAHGGCKAYIDGLMDDENNQAVEVAISSGKPVIVYKNGKDRSDALPFKTKEDEDHFYRLYIQAKLFNGEIEFGSKEEKEALKKWIQEKGVEEFRGYFEKNILATKPRRFADEYQTSTLRALFDEIRRGD